MKALTIWQPWANLIMGNVQLSRQARQLGLTLPKDVENRSWQNFHIGDLLIHAGKKVDIDYMYLLADGQCLQTGVILGTVKVCGYTRGSVSPWAAAGGWHWCLRNPRPFHKPIPYRGAQGLFEIPNEILKEQF